MKTVLVTGASGNLGKDVVEHLHQQGYAVLATFHSSRDIGAFNHLPQVKTQAVNVLDADSVTEFLDAHKSANLRAAVLLVGGFAMGGLEETNAELLQKMYQLNFLSAFNVVKPLMTRFKEQGGGQFVLIGARSARNPEESKNVVAYALSKSLILSLAELINADGKTAQVTASVVVPGIIDTPPNRIAMPDADPGKWVPTENIADLIAFLLSDTGRMTRHTIIDIFNKA